MHTCVYTDMCIQTIYIDLKKIPVAYKELLLQQTASTTLRCVTCWAAVPSGFERLENCSQKRNICLH